MLSVEHFTVFNEWCSLSTDQSDYQVCSLIDSLNNWVLVWVYITKKKKKNLGGFWSFCFPTQHCLELGSLLVFIVRFTGFLTENISSWFEHAQ